MAFSIGTSAKANWNGHLGGVCYGFKPYAHPSVLFRVAQYARTIYLRKLTAQSRIVASSKTMVYNRDACIEVAQEN